MGTNSKNVEISDSALETASKLKTFFNIDALTPEEIVRQLRKSAENPDIQKQTKKLKTFQNGPKLP